MHPQQSRTPANSKLDVVSSALRNLSLLRLYEGGGPICWWLGCGYYVRRCAPFRHMYLTPLNNTSSSTPVILLHHSDPVAAPSRSSTRACSALFMFNVVTMTCISATIAVVLWATIAYRVYLIFLMILFSISTASMHTKTTVLAAPSLLL